MSPRLSFLPLSSFSPLRLDASQARDSRELADKHFSLLVATDLAKGDGSGPPAVRLLDFSSFVYCSP